MKIDDESFYLDGENTMLNLRNGGGKSVLVQMIMAPFVNRRYRSTKDRPFESYFTSQTPTFILVEWKLDDGAGYLLTGMVVRKKEAASDKDLKEYLRLKKELDPLNLSNPAKSFSPDWRIAYFLKLAYSTSRLFSNGNPFFKPFLKIMSPNHEKHQRSLLEPDACANCGACIAVCPAYFTERSEIITAKGKLFLLKQLLKGSSIPKPVAENIFLCLHCHLCEYVCQSKLTLVPLWDKLEAIAENTYGRPKEKIDEFIKKAESHPDYTKLLDSLGASSNNNHQEEKYV